MINVLVATAIVATGLATTSCRTESAGQSQRGISRGLWIVTERHRH